MKRILPFLILVASFASQTTVARADTWSPTTGSMPVARRDHTATLLTNGQVLIVGGTSTGALLYDPTTSVFSPTTGAPLYEPGQGSTATRLLDGTVLIVGGTGGQQSAQIYNPTAGTFSQTTGSPTYIHSYHTATLLPDGRVLIAGGQDENAGPKSTNLAELYDPTNRTFTLTTGVLNVDRTDHSATLLPNGKVLIAGGTQTDPLHPGYGTALSSTELFDPVYQTFTLGPNMSVARSGPMATLLPSGMVLISGWLYAAADLYDPATNTITPTGPMTTPHGAATATLLPDGQVLVAGGFTATGPVTTNSAELYDPVTGTFTATTSMSVARQEHTATLLPGSLVLVVGGYNSTTNGDLASAEFFTPTIPQPYSPIAEPLITTGGTNTYQYTSNQKPFSWSAMYPGVLTDPNLVLQPILISQDDLKALVKGTGFDGALIVPYDGTGGFGVLFRATCQDSSGNPVTCPLTTGPYDVNTSWITPSSASTISNPAFLKAPVGTNAWQNIFTAFSEADPMGGGRTCCSFSDFVFVDLGASVGSTPTIVINTPQNGAVYPLNAQEAASYSCSPSPPVVSCIGDVPNGSYVDTSSVGSKTFTVNANVNAGPAGVKTVTYQVVLAITTVTWATPAAITYGTALSGAQLNATASVAGTFAYSPTAGTVLGAGSHTLSVTLTPTDTADYSTATASVTLQVNQATPVITWTPAPIQLGYSLGAAQLDATASVSGASVPGTFTYTPPLGYVVTTSSLTLSVLFTPTDTTNYTTASMSVSLTVTPGPLASVSPSSINFGTVYLGTITTKNVTVTNQGTAPMTITDPLLSIVSGGNSKEFVALNLCPKSLAAGKSCTISVIFVAGPFYTKQTATLKVMDNAPGSPQTVALSATVINPQAHLSATSLSFGTQKVSTSSAPPKAVTLTNTGATALTINSIVIAGRNQGDFMETDSCPRSPGFLAANISCTVNVTFKPIEKGLLSASVVITDNAQNSPQHISLSGTGK